jgi:predicted house-cleaning noncanonical NTP pyrophosphatase (MazG superfamily)
MDFLKVRGHDKLVRDPHSKAILNTDKMALEKYLADRDLAEKQKKDKEEVTERLQKLETDMSEIKHLLYEIAKMRTTNAN